ncbi:GNAT family N-acetyltransferase [Brasilonema sp. UFV-L1]|uniref:GNAT family N-acetyltransferase n=1 Tax=Brasilonema sp. UFV-L1 TaxID=2234130 RepID=UPI00145F5E78|nr:GNAT family N-acetyltransferase [Brasilonema sp. UFV-L1]NMG09834.1 GNAT family N-acetyltransferase [Brasilonema sp. UFV-L1]
MSINSSTDFALEAGYSARRLEPNDEEVLQQLYEQCTDFANLTEGHPPSPSAAHEEFLAVPEGKTLQDKFMFGFFDVHNVLVGLIEAIRHYPDDRSWWVGLMMLAPQERGKGLGSKFYKAFERWVSAQKAQQVMLAVIEENEQGFLFWKKIGFEVTRKTPPRQFGKKTHMLYVMTKTVEVSD